MRATRATNATDARHVSTRDAARARATARAIARAILSSPMIRAGVYLHTPFCRSRCSYCDFATGHYDAALAARYVRALVREIETFTATRETANAPARATLHARDE